MSTANPFFLAPLREICCEEIQKCDNDPY